MKPQLYKHAPACAGYENLDFGLVRVGGLCFYRREFHDAVGEFVGGVTPRFWGEAFAFKSVATNLHRRANASPLPANFRGEGLDPWLIDQQHHGIRG